MSDPAARLSRNDIAKRVARELPDGGVVNLGIGIPSLCANFVPAGIHLRYHAENGILGFGEHFPDGEGDPDVMDAGGKFPRRVPGMAFFDSVESFAMIRGGHIDVTVLGGLQVSRCGDLANWMIPSRGIGSIGGAMDLAANTKRVIVAMEHTAKGDVPKIVEQCSYPLTAPRCVDLIVTDIAVIEIVQASGSQDETGLKPALGRFTEDCLVLREVAPGWDPESVQMLTGARLELAPQIKVMDVR